MKKRIGYVPYCYKADSKLMLGLFPWEPQTQKKTREDIKLNQYSKECKFKILPVFVEIPNQSGKGE